MLNERQCEKTIFGSFDPVRHKLAYTVPEEGQELEILVLSRGGIVLCVQ